MRVFNALIMMFVAALVLALPLEAFALNTAAGTDITNTATVDYEVGGIPQPQVPSNTATFKVDNKVDLTIARVGGYVTVVPGSLAQVLEFTVTNTGNGTQDYSLAATHGSDELGGADNFNAANVNVFVEDGTTVGYQALEDTATSIDDLLKDTPITVYVVSDIPIVQVNGDISAIALTATTLTSAGGAISETAAGDETLGAVDIVFADGAGDTDVANDAKHSDTHSYKVGAASLTVTKVPVIISDPINGAVNPLAIPGAIVEYTITVSSAVGSAQATSITVSDTMPANVTYVPGSIKVQAPNLYAGAETALTDAVGGPDDEGQFVDPTVTVNGITLDATETATVKFRVTIN